jgi:hypothetical protein
VAIAGLVLVLFAVVWRVPGAAAAGHGEATEAAGQVFHHHFAGVEARGFATGTAHQCVAAVRRRRVWRHADFRATPDHELKSVATATTATVEPDGSWLFSHYANTTFGGERIESQHQETRAFQVGGRRRFQR